MKPLIRDPNILGYFFLLVNVFTLGVQARHYEDIFKYDKFFSQSLQAPPMPKGWTSCGEASDQFQIKGIFLTPDPPKRARTMSVRVMGTLKEALVGGRVNYTVHFGIIPIVQDSTPLCEVLKMEPGLPQCPLHAGDWDVSHSVQFPAEAPFGKYSIKAVAWDPEGRQLFCVQGTTVVGLLGEGISQEGEKHGGVESAINIKSGATYLLMGQKRERGLSGEESEVEYESQDTRKPEDGDHDAVVPAKECSGDRQVIFPDL